jgi:uncharacterized membrane protein
LSAPYSLPVWATAGLGVASAFGLVAWHVFERKSRDTSERILDSFPGRVSVVETVVVLLVLLAALALRVHGLLERPAWEDEMWTLRNIYTSSWAELFRVAFEDYWPPFYYVILNAVARVTDTSLLALRTPSVIFGVAAVAAMYPLGMELFRRRFPALVATTMLAGMTTHIMFSQEARVYSLQVLLVVLSALYFYRSYRRGRFSWGFLIATTLLAYSHSFASWYFVSAQGVFLLVAWAVWRDRDRLRLALGAQVLVVALTLPLAGAFTYSRFARDIPVPTSWAYASDQQPRLIDLIELYQTLAIRSWAGAALMALLLLLAFGTLRSLESSQRGELGDCIEESSVVPPTNPPAVLFLLSWVIVPVLFSLTVTIFTPLDTVEEFRYHLTIVPGICLLFAAGAEQVRTRAGRAAIAGLLILLPAAELPRYYRELRRPAVDDAATLIREFGKPGEPIFIANSFRALAYYLREDFPRIGSPAWDQMAAQFSPLRDSFTMWGYKWGNTRAFEKIAPEIRFFGYWGSIDENPLERFAREEVARGHMSGAYWLLLRPRRDEAFVAEVDRLGVRCDDMAVWHVEGLEVRHCNAGAPTPTLSP